ncbi:MAG: transposase [Leptospiraceae bacterium]|nr:transposase [Leptospiraceae bacterium]
MPQSGYRSVTYFLRNDMKINHKRVYRIMHENL